MRRMKTALTSAAVLAIGVGLMSAYAGPPAGDKPKKEKKPAGPLCPVMGNPIDFTASTMTKDGPVYFCCPGCEKKLKADPKKYAEKVAAQREALAKLPRIQLACPVSGKPVVKDVSVKHEGQKVFFCCKGCPAKFQKNPAKYQAKLLASYTYQTKCPVSGEEIDPKVVTTLKNGQKVHFCCEKCVKKFLDKPAKYTPDLAKQGYPIDPKDVKA